MSLDDLSPADLDAVLAFLTALGDDEYLHGDRLSAWLTVAPTLEEDNVLTSIAQDEMGHARLWFELVATHREATVDDLAIHRAAIDRRNSTLVEREFEGFADTVIRSYLYDQYERVLLSAVEEGDLAPLAERAGIALDEESFHREHAEEWLAVFDVLERADDRDRVREAVRSNLRHAGDLFAFPDAGRLHDCGALARSVETLRDSWREATVPRLADLPLGLDEAAVREQLGSGAFDGRAGEHTADLDALIDEMRPRELEALDQ